MIRRPGLSPFAVVKILDDAPTVSKRSRIPPTAATTSGRFDSTSNEILEMNDLFAAGWSPTWARIPNPARVAGGSPPRRASRSGCAGGLASAGVAVVRKRLPALVLGSRHHHAGVQTGQDRSCARGGPSGSRVRLHLGECAQEAIAVTRVHTEGCNLLNRHRYPQPGRWHIDRRATRRTVIALRA